MATETRPRVIFMAFGTQGDVYPLAAVAAGLAEAKPHCLVFFITHSAHESLTKVLSASGVKLVSITSPPVLSASCLHQYITANESIHSRPQLIKHTDDIGWKSKIEEQHRQECLMAVGKILNDEQHGGHMIINFFALEGWHLAELYQVPCAVAAPYVMPYSAPASFERRFIKSNPLLYDKLKRRVPGKVGWDDVVHWMWPLFMDRWKEWRAKHLHLSSCLLTDPVTELPIVHNWPVEPLLLYGFSKHVVECPSYWPSNVHACGFWFLKASVPGFESQQSAYPELTAFLKESATPPIFFGLSSIGSMGLIDNPEGMLGVLRGVLKAANRRAVLFTAAYAPLEAAVSTAASQEEWATAYVAKEADDKLCTERPAVEKALQNGMHLFDDSLFCFSGCVLILHYVLQACNFSWVPNFRHIVSSSSVPYLWLFPKCSLIVHHGGSGTTAAALHAGIPQVVCPFVLDQFYWAERMAWIGVAPQPLKREYLAPPANFEMHVAVSNLLHTIHEASSPRIQACAADFGEKIRNEDGVQLAVEALCRTMHM